MKKLLLSLICGLVLNCSYAEIPYVNLERFNLCNEAEQYFINNSTNLASIEGVWATTWRATQYSHLSSRPKIDEIETIFYIVRAIDPDDCFGVYVCHDDRLEWYCSIRELGKGLYSMGWSPKTCENSDIKTFRVKNNMFSITFRNLSPKLKKQIFNGIGSNVSVEIKISGEKIDPSDY